MKLSSILRAQAGITVGETEYQPFPKATVDAVDNLIKLWQQAGEPEFIDHKSEHHWKLMDFLVRMWASLYPEEAAAFALSTKEIRNSQTDRGMAKEKNAMIQHQMEIPERLHTMIRAIFPAQNYSKEFVYELGRRYPFMKVGA